MIVVRQIFNAKPGCWPKFADLLKRTRERTGVNSRIHRCIVGNRDQVVLEAEFEDFADMEKSMSEWLTSSEREAFMEEMLPLIEGGSIREIWSVIE